MSLASLTPSPAAGFDMPLTLLAACHQRILQFCSMLERLLVHIENHGVDDLQSVETSRLIHRYFSSAGKHHHQDEEQDLFPMLLQHEPDLEPLLSQLADTHKQLDASWEQLAPLLQSLPDTSIPDLSMAALNFAKQSREHVQFENRELLPRAAMLLTTTEQQRLGIAMAKRRNIQQASISRV